MPGMVSEKPRTRSSSWPRGAGSPGGRPARILPPPLVRGPQESKFLSQENNCVIFCFNEQLQFLRQIRFKVTKPKFLYILTWKA